MMHILHNYALRCSRCICKGMIHSNALMTAGQVVEGRGGEDLEGDGVHSAICHAKLLGQTEGGAQIGSIEGRSSYNGFISIQMPAINSD